MMGNDFGKYIMRIHFMGGADTVTGSQHIVEANGFQILRDCGLFQGKRREAEKINSEFLYDPGALHSMILSHAHIDHCGCIPKLIASNFQKPIHAISATTEIAAIMMKDSARIQEQDAAYLNQKNNRKGQPPVRPLYTVEDAEAAAKLMVGHDYHRRMELAPGIAHESFDAGHVLGSALSLFTLEESGRRHRLGFAVDLGRRGLPILRDPEYIGEVDTLVIESTYGNRRHDNANSATAQLGEVVRRTLERRGKVLIPAFALERAQEIIYHLGRLWCDGQLPHAPIYMDSPMATAITRVFGQQLDLFDEDAHHLLKCIRSPFGGGFIHFTSNVEESKAITASDEPCIVIAASGMCESGRILHHLKAGIGNPLNSVAIVGYQAINTLGRRLMEGEKIVRIFGDEFDVKAEIHTLKAFSAHADSEELMNYVRHVRPARTFLVHGEQESREAFAESIRAEKLSDVYLPRRGEVIEL